MKNLTCRSGFVLLLTVFTAAVYAQDLSIDYRYNVSGPDPNNYLTYQNDYGDMMAMFNWDRTLAVNFENPILTIKGTLRPVKR